MPATTGPDTLMATYPNIGGEDSSFSGAADNGDLLSLSGLISPDDWRLYHIMRELNGEDRFRVLTFAEMLFNLERAKEWAKAQALG
jgi:hypothetical protein